ncbi:hypothetical protein [Marinigracilibium pacificum]|uniref:Uncharacterized protein n=1 Tax=Marinigracilibium pacificum TaxID=2729599 RepID=A0A848J285_9BACT|nr:hypothetical protein [Marinigracilibium pacificum]NMM49896.1 hypothetical protein [Marinigracilibium pacificum]
MRAFRNNFLILVFVTVLCFSCDEDDSLELQEKPDTFNSIGIGEQLFNINSVILKNNGVDDSESPEYFGNEFELILLTDDLKVDSLDGFSIEGEGLYMSLKIYANELAESDYSSLNGETPISTGRFKASYSKQWNADGNEISWSDTYGGYIRYKKFDDGKHSLTFYGFDSPTDTVRASYFGSVIYLD